MSITDRESELDNLVTIAQEGLELESFERTDPGKIIVRESRQAYKVCLSIILSATSGKEELDKAISELRVQHRVLEMITSTIARGRRAEKLINLHESAIPIDEFDSTQESA